MWRLFAAAVLLAAEARAQDTIVKPKPLTSFDRQRLSVQRQMQSVREYFPATAPATPITPIAANCPPVSKESVKPIIDREAARNNIDPRLVQAVVETESAYSPCAVSPAGALGLMQLMPSTAETMQVTDPFDPEQNIKGGTQFLRLMLDRYGGDLAKALAAYNAGPSRVDEAGGIPPIPETQEYVRKILAVPKIKNGEKSP